MLAGFRVTNGIADSLPASFRSGIFGLNTLPPERAPRDGASDSAFSWKFGGIGSRFVFRGNWDSGTVIFVSVGSWMFYCDLIDF